MTLQKDKDFNYSDTDADDMIKLHLVTDRCSLMYNFKNVDTLEKSRTEKKHKVNIAREKKTINLTNSYRRLLFNC